MATYAYRWADGTVSVCSAKNKDEAAWLFDEIGPISRKLIIRLKSQVLVTLRPDIDVRWKLDDQDPKLGEEIDLELHERCYPCYDKAYWEAMAKLDPKNEKLEARPDMRKEIETALQMDAQQAKGRVKRTPKTLDIVLVYPKGLPGQNN